LSFGKELYLNRPLEKSSEQIKSFIEKNPSYKSILIFYEELLKLQEAIKPSLNVPRVHVKKDVLNLQAREGFSLLNKEDFIVDIPSSVNLFESICRTGKNANEKMKENIQFIEEAILTKKLDPGELLQKHYDISYIDRVAGEYRIDKAILNFLIHMSIQPSIHANVENVKELVDLKNWLRGYCPICGSLPQISTLKGEGQRYFLCSFCGFEWHSERLKCPFCENRDHNKLHYFYEENKKVYRVDLCDNCKHYIKTIDSRELNYDPDLYLEDITTIHLDILADKQGYKRPAPTPWGI
jgi:FdhE protein